MTSFAISEVIVEGWPTWLFGLSATSPLSSALVSFEVGEVAVQMVHVMTTKLCLKFCFQFKDSSIHFDEYHT